MKAAILGTTGYTGMILLRLLSEHPDIDTILPVSSSRAGTPVLQIDHGLHPKVVDKCTGNDGKLLSISEAVAEKPDVVFAALPHLKSAEICAPFFGNSVIIDLSADFRIKDRVIFEKAYGQEPPRPDLQSKAVYGLCEIYETEIKSADLIANPGCYPTCTLLPLIPLIEGDLIRGKIIANALSGISGAGRKAKENLIFCERTENTNAYAPGKCHRHSKEIQQEVESAAARFGMVKVGTTEKVMTDASHYSKSASTGAARIQSSPDVYFTPHLVPLKRGMAVTTAVSLSPGKVESDIADALIEIYGNEPFINLTENTIPESVQVWGSNRCDIGWHVEGDTLFLFSVIDNLMKGASGQAVQNMNIRFGLEETQGLPMHGEL